MTTEQNTNSSAQSTAPVDVPEHIAKCVDLNSFVTFIENEPGALGLFLKGHHGVENLLNASLIEALPESDAIELSRITFLLKVDLLIALGLISRIQRPLFNRLNNYRNKFAHNPHFQIDDTYSEETSKLIHSLAPVAEKFEQSDERIDLIPERRLVFICWAGCLHTLTAACKRNIASEVTGRAIEKMEGCALDVVKNAESIGNHWRQCEAELLKERYPTFFSQWPTHINKDPDASPTA